MVEFFVASRCARWARRAAASRAFRFYVLSLLLLPRRRHQNYKTHIFSIQNPSQVYASTTPTAKPKCHISQNEQQTHYNTSNPDQSSTFTFTMMPCSLLFIFVSFPRLPGAAAQVHHTTLTISSQRELLPGDAMTQDVNSDVPFKFRRN